MAEEGALYWIDVKAPALYRFDWTTHVTREWPLPSDVGGFALVAGQRCAVVALRYGLFRLNLESDALTRIAPPPFDPSLFRFNEGACDSTGRLWLGVMYDPEGGAGGSPQQAILHSFTLAGGLQPQGDAADLHNGMAWSADEQVFYLSHSKQGTVFAFPFDRVAGSLGERRGFVTIPKAQGVPDGAAVDVEGGYWCAMHGSSRVRRYRPDGTLDREVLLPVSQPTMCAFAGPDLDVMVVTSAADKLTPQQLGEQPHAGGLFAFRPNIRGISRYCHVS